MLFATFLPTWQQQMLVQDLLLGTLEDLDGAGFDTFKWHLSHPTLEGCTPLSKAHLEHAHRTDTVDQLMAAYGQREAVNVTIEVLRKMKNNLAADQLSESVGRRYHTGNPMKTFLLLRLPFCFFL